MPHQLNLWGQAASSVSSFLHPIPVADGELWWGENFWQQAALQPNADEVFQQLHTQVDWRQEFITLYGKRRPQPRLTAWYGDEGTTYRYSGLTLQPCRWLPVLQNIRAVVETAAACRFNSVLLNLYRTGQDSMGWHSDNEPELGRNPAIASLSFGATRRFIMRRCDRKDAAKVELSLSHGSLLLMKGKLQHHWQHQVPKTSKIVGPRINLTFRWIA